MLDYKGLEALHMTINLQNFELAAKKLFITQSAISQRIKALEDYYGEPLLIRTLPYRPTKLGEQLIAHYKKIATLEKELKNELEGIQGQHSLAIAINRDSLETWFLNLLSEDNFKDVVLEIIADDQELTLNYLKSGKVSACLSTCEKEILGGNVAFLGNMEYLLVASPAYVKRYFSSNNVRTCLQKAKALKFDHNDKLHERYLEKFFGINGNDVTFQVIPSVQGFKKCALLGYGYGLIPKIDIESELKEKQLVQIFPNKTWEIPLFWHYLNIQSPFFKNFNKALISLIRKKFQD